MSSNKETFVCLSALYVISCITYSEHKLTNLPLSCFPPQVLTNWFVSIKLVDYPYFSRSKGPADSFPGRNSDKGKVVMGDNNEEISLTNVVVAQPTIQIRIN